MDSKGLYATELLEQTYSTLCNRHNPNKIMLPRKARAEIADDSDWHRTKKGYMAYESAAIFELNNKIWAITKGEATGAYPADPYDTDISALEFDLHNKSNEQIQKELYESIKDSSYFMNSLIYSLSDGMLATSNGKLGKRMSSILKPRLNEFIAQQPIYDSEYMLISTLAPICREPVLYKHKLVDFLADTIEKVLSL